MNIDRLAASVSREIVVDVSVDGRYISMGIWYSDGDSINIYPEAVPGGWRISDKGLTAEKLYDRGVRLPLLARNTIEYLKNRFGVELDGSKLTKRLNPGCAGRACLDLCQAICFLTAAATPTA